MSLTEDDIYRTSTQYRLWSFTSSSLASLRATTNKSAAERVVAAIDRHRASRPAVQHDRSNGHGDASSTSLPDDSASRSIDTLTSLEELKILTHYTRQLLAWSTTAFRFPSAVTFTAACYFRRFYLTNSPMTYHPKAIMPTCLFLATKTENQPISLNGFVRILQDAPIRSKLTRDDVLAPEFLVTQGLRFTFDVRHPLRGLGAGWMELTSLARADGIASRGLDKTAVQLQAEMLALPPPPPWTDRSGREHRVPPTLTAADAISRAGDVHGHAKEVLSEAALLTDAYFLFTPAQMWLAALLLADEVLFTWYFGLRLGRLSDAPKAAIMGTIRACAALLASYAGGTAPGLAHKDDLIRIDKKLYQCQNPEKLDLVGLNRAQKRGANDKDGGGGAGGGVTESATKKRKLQERNGEDDVFGDPLPTRKKEREGE